jgi:hypothetical protein
MGPAATEVHQKAALFLMMGRSPRWYGRAKPTGHSREIPQLRDTSVVTRRPEIETHKLASGSCGPEPEGRHNWRLSEFCGTPKKFGDPTKIRPSHINPTNFPNRVLALSKVRAAEGNIVPGQSRIGRTQRTGEIPKIRRVDSS